MATYLVKELPGNAFTTVKSNDVKVEMYEKVIGPFDDISNAADELSKMIQAEETISSEGWKMIVTDFPQKKAMRKREDGPMLPDTDISSKDSWLGRKTLTGYNG